MLLGALNVAVQDAGYNDCRHTYACNTTQLVGPGGAPSQGEIDRLQSGLEQARRELSSSKANQEQLVASQQVAIAGMTERLNKQSDRYNELSKVRACGARRWGHAAGVRGLGRIGCAWMWHVLWRASWLRVCRPARSCLTVRLAECSCTRCGLLVGCERRSTSR